MAKKIVNEIEPMIPRNYVVGQRVYGVRTPSAHRGEFVRAYVTLNNGWRNPAYVVKCDIDGKERVFQQLRPADSTKKFPDYFTIK